jgi:tetratricopeptide (TPR) repeat protein
MASLLSPSAISFAVHNFFQLKSSKLFTLHSRISNQPAVLRISIRPFNCNLHKTACTKNPQSIIQSVAKGSALFIIGSFLFLSQFHLKPALATVTPRSSNHSSPVEEKSNTEKEKKRKENKNRKKNKNYDEVLEMYERFSEKNPTDREALKVVLYGKLRKGEMEEALEYIKRLVIVPLLLYRISVMYQPDTGRKMYQSSKATSSQALKIGDCFCCIICDNHLN